MLMSAVRRGGKRTAILGASMAIFLIGSLAGRAQAVTVKGTAVLEPNPVGDPVSGTVTFNLPHHAWISGIVWVIPDPTLQGEHTCEILAAQTADPVQGGAIAPGNVTVYARLQKGRKPGSVFTGEVTRRPDLSLFNAGCDGIPGNGDKFEGGVTSTYAAPAVYLAQSMASTGRHPDGLPVKDEIYDAFEIDSARTEITPKLLEFHSFDPGLNPGGSAVGRASAQISLKFKAPK